MKNNTTHFYSIPEEKNKFILDMDEIIKKVEIGDRMGRFYVKVNDPEIAGFWPIGDTIQIRSTAYGDRLEFGYMQKKFFCYPKFIMCDYVPIHIVQAVEVLPYE